jgi:carbonic anhydrase/acetyltransferase-like protein (isoleucine patch superfamily)
MEKETKTALPVSILIPLFLCILAAFPVCVAGFPILVASSLSARLVALAFAPVLGSLAFVGLSVLLSFPFQAAIIRGKFPRDLTHVVYGPRRLYALCWCAVFYCTPIYYAFMSVPSLRKFLYRGFGYRGENDINIAPDAWIRDLPLLNFGSGAYVANKATIGTNICLAGGEILVDAVTLGNDSIVGHLTMVAPGCKIGSHVEVGVGSGIGIRASIGTRTRVGPTTTVNHGAQIGSAVDIGTMSYIGVKARIADGIRLPSGSNIPEGAEIKSQEEVASYLSSETRMLSEERTRLASIYGARENVLRAASSE